METGKYTISQLARAAGVPTSTLRYYERAGLLEPEPRRAGDYRLYNEDSLHRLRFIRAAQAIGFTLDDVRSLLAGPEGDAPPCRDVRGLIESRLADTERRLADLQHVQRVLRSALEQCRTGQPTGGCRVVEALQPRSSSAESERH